MADRIYSHIIIIGGFLVFKDHGNYFVHQATSEDDDENNVWTINVKSEVFGKLLENKLQYRTHDVWIPLWLCRKIKQTHWSIMRSSIRKNVLLFVC